MNTEQTSYSAVLGVVLANLRKERQLEQGEVAASIGLSQASYSRLESGKSAFSIDQMYQVAKAMDISDIDISARLNNTIQNLRDNGVTVIPQVRGNTTQAKQDIGPVGGFVMGAALGALLISLLSKK